MVASILKIELRLDNDVVLARQRTRQIAALVGFDVHDQTRIATALSEVARNAFQYAGGGRVDIALEQGRDLALLIEVKDEGAGISDLPSILEGRYVSPTGMGVGIVGARRLMDAVQIDTSRRGTTVKLSKVLPRAPRPPLQELVAHVASELAKQRPFDALAESQLVNQELLRTLDDLRRQKADLAQVNKELEETNRGVLALYAELDEKADYLQRANEVKTRFLSNMTHEFRTPVNSIISLTHILLQRIDGELTSEQEKQLRYIDRAANGLSELVNDLLDLAKVEAGKVVVHPVEFEVSELFGTLRGMLRPLLAHNSAVNLIFEESGELPRMYTDESKVSQIVRNFISNALKFTQRGEIRVSAMQEPGGTVVFSVSDTGIGIAAEDQERIFEDFVQVDSPIQRRVKGTGLGLALSRKLSVLLGGSVGVRSQVGVGSTFFAVIPGTYEHRGDGPFGPEVSRSFDPTRLPVLVIEDNAEAVFVYEKYLQVTPYQILAARTLKHAREWLRVVHPAAILLDVLLEGESTWNFLAQLRKDDDTRETPLIVITMVENEKRALALGADAFHTKPVPREWLISKLDGLTRGRRPQDKVLVIDDDEVSRYLLRGLLARTRFQVVEAANGEDGLQRARSEKPSAIFLDLAMPGLDGFQLLERITSDPLLATIPVIVHTAKVVSVAERERLSGAAAIVLKQSPSRDAALASIRDALVAAGLRTT
jgi:signal transduction histidine kinase/CheY-like chemotaxis protein